MAVEPNIELAGYYIDALDDANPVGTTSQVKELDNHVRGIKNTLLNTFANVTGAVTATHTELNYVDVVAGTATASKALVLDGSKNATGIGELTGTRWNGAVTGDVTGDVTGNVTGNCSGQAGTIASQGALATLNSVAAAQINTGAVGASELATGSVHQSEISLGTQQGASAVGTLVSFIFTGGAYTFMVGTSSTGSAGLNDLSNGAGAAYSYGLTLKAANLQTSYYKCGYIQSSPPYDMGDGDVPLYVFALVDSNGKIVATDVARDPTWAANGPTDTKGKTHKNGKTYKKELLIPPGYDTLSPKEKLAARREAQVMMVEVTQAVKHADMDLLPHPWVGMDLKSLGLTPVLLDPVSDCVRDLAELTELGENTCDILLDGYVKIGNTCLKRCGPAGLMMPATEWR